MCHIILIPGILKLENAYLETVTNAQFTQKAKMGESDIQGLYKIFKQGSFQAYWSTEMKNNFKSDKKRPSKHN